MKKSIIIIVLFLLAFGVDYKNINAQSVDKAGESTQVKNPAIEYVEGEVIVQFKKEVSLIKQIEQDYQLTKTKELRNIKFYLLKSNNNRSTEEVITDLKKNSNIEIVQPNYIYHAKAQTTPWGVSTNGVQADTEWATNGATGSGVVVAVIDSGINYNHEDLSANMWDAPAGSCLVSSVPQVCPHHGWDFVSSGDLVDGSDGREDDPMDINGHGTHVSGTVAAADNGLGVVGVAPNAQLMAVRALDDDGSGTSADIAAGIDFARENSADIINLSIGGYAYDAVENTAINAAWDAGIVVVAASGNESETLLSYPAAFEKSIAVGAIQETETAINPTEDMQTKLAYFSNYGYTDVVAPGMNIYSTTVDGSYQDGWSGSSMASPHVAGVAALILQQHPTFTPAQIKQLLEATATDLGSTGRDQYFGSGLVNATAATAALSNKIILSANYIHDNGIGSAPDLYLPEIPADGIATAHIKVVVTDSNGDFVDGVTVAISTDKGTLSAASITTTSGVAEFSILADDTPGTATITADGGIYGVATVQLDMANILLVSDSAEWYYANNFSWFNTQAIADSGKQFVRYNTFWGSGLDDFPSTEYMQKFDLVIWYMGDFYPTTTGKTAIQNYLDANGKLIITGPDQLYWLNWYGYDKSIYNNYFKANYSGDGPSNQTDVTGNGIFSGLTLDFTDPGYIIGFFPDYITLETGGEQLGTYTSGEIAGSLYNGAYKTLYLPYGLEALSTKAMRQDVLNRIYSFALPVSGLSISSVDSDSALITWDTFENSALTSYIASYGTDAVATSAGTADTTINSITLENLSPNTLYYVKVAGKISDGSITEYSEIASFTTANIAPGTIKKKIQKAHVIKIKWSVPSDIPDSYIISYGTDTDAENKGLIPRTSNYKKFSNLKSNQAYYFKVLAVKNGVYSSYSPIKKIRTKPARVKNLKITQDEDDIKIAWSKVRGKNIKYKIKVMNENKEAFDLYKTKKLKKIINNSTVGETIFVKVRAKHIKSKLLGRWSKIKKFAIITTD
jgi:subtilisin family serine protease